MNRAIAWFVRNPVAAHVLVILVVVFGVFALKDIKKSLLPNLTFDWLTIAVSYPGASPTEMEQAVIAPIESAIAATPGITSLDSTASENGGYIKIGLESGVNAQALKDTLQSQIDAIRGLPELVEHPKVSLVSLKVEPVSTLVVHGHADSSALKSIAEKIKQDLLDHPEITAVYIANDQSDAIHIEASELALQRYGLTLAELANAINRQSISTPAGVINTPNSTLAIRTVGEVRTAEGFENVVVRVFPDGGRVRVGDVAKVTKGGKKTQNTSDFNGDPAVYINIMRSGKQDLLSIANIVRDYAEHPKIQLPHGLKLDITQDVSHYFRSRMDLLIRNGLEGLALIFIPLLFFLRWRLSFWVTSDIPFSFLGAIWVLYSLGGSFDMVSLFGFIIVLGIIGDDSIVVGENIFRHHQAGRSGAEGAILGAQELAAPVVYSSIATIIMFVPLLFLPGVEGKLIQSIPIVVISVMVFSLFEALFVLPSHLSHVVKEKPSLLGRISHWLSDAIDRFIAHIYRPILEKSLHWRYAVISFFIMLFLLALALISSGWQKTVLSTGIEADTIQASITFPLGTRPEIMHAEVKRLEQAAIKIKKALSQETGTEQIQNVITHYSGNAISKNQSIGEVGGSVVIEMTPAEHRTLSGEDISKRWRHYMGAVPENEFIDFESTLNQPGPSIDIRLTSPDLKQLYRASTDLKELLSEYNGVYSVRDSFQQGHQEIRLHLKPLAEELGMKTTEVAQQVRQAFYGIELHSVQQGEQEIRVTLGYPEEEKKSLWYLENMQIKLPSGASTTLQNIADVNFDTGPNLISRSQQKRAVRVSAFVDEGATHSGYVMQQIQKKFLDHLQDRYDNVKWEAAGEPASQKEFKNTLYRNTSIALLGMYLMMAISFRSFMHGLVVMSAVPFGFVGAVLGHLLFGMDITLWSLIGMTTVFGIVVNHNVVLVDYIQRQQEEGANLFDALRDSGAMRFRPIFLTTLTAVCGLLPVIFEPATQSAFLIPMSISLACGVLFATLISLLFVPCLYHISMDVAQLKKRLFKTADQHTMSQ